MTLKRVQGGDGLKTGQLNQFVDEFASMASSRTGRRLDPNLLPGNPVWAVNNTSADLLMGEVAAIAGSPYVGNAAGIVTDNLVLDLRDVGAGDEDNWVVAANYIPQGDAGWVYSDGIALARLEPEGSGSPPGDYVQAVPGAAYLALSDQGAGILVADLAQTATSGVGEWALVRFSGATAVGGGGAGPSPGTPTVYVVKEGDGAPGTGSPYMRADALFELQLRAGAGPTALDESGLEMAEEPNKLGVLWEKDDGYILPVSGTVASLGDRGAVARSNHEHGYDGTSFAGTGISWGGGKFSLTTAVPAKYTSTPESVSDTTGAPGASDDYSPGNHKHPFDGTAFAGSNLAWSGGQFNASAPTHDLLSATHTDTLAAGVSAGDLVIGNATPKWARLGIGSSDEVLTVGGSNLPAWTDTLTLASLISTGDVEIKGGSELRLWDVGSSHYIGHKAPALTATTAYTWPAAADVGKYLKTDAAGVLSWDTPGGAGAGSIVQASATATTITTSWVIMNFTNEDIDTGGDYNPTTKKFTAPVAGKYRVSLTNRVVLVGFTAFHNVAMGIAKNGTLTKTCEWNQNAGGANSTFSLHIDEILDLAVNDTVEAQIKKTGTDTSQYSGYGGSSFNIVGPL